MTWIEDEDVFSMLAYLLEAKGSIGAMMDLADEKHAAVLLENHRRVDCAIGTLLDAEKRRKSEQVRERIKGTH